MNCAACGNPIPQDAQACPYCGLPMKQQPVNVYQQSYAQYQTGGVPAGYQQPYGYAHASQRPGLLASLSELPRAFLSSFSRPGEVLYGMVERRDLLSGPVMLALVLALTFLAGMVIMRGFVGVLFEAVSVLTGVSMAGSAASMNQGISYIAGRVAPAAGGIAALCQLISMAVPVLVFMLYICVICKVTFSWELALGFLAVTSLNTVAASLLAMALSLISPWLALLPVLCGMVVSYTKACGMLGLIIARPEGELMPAKLVCTVVSVLVTMLLCGGVGGWLMSGVMRRILVLLSSVGSLI